MSTQARPGTDAPGRTPRRVSAFTDDALGEHDAVALADLVRRHVVSPAELTQAAIARANAVEAQLHAIACAAFDNPRVSPDPSRPLYGVPTFVKDNTDLAGLPTNHGSEAFVAVPAKADGRYTRQLLSSGVTVLGKSRMPEFGLNATTEFMTQPPTRNPWDLDRSVGASSGGAAALVASGVVPIAHANDGGGSIRIPAAAAGLVGLKPTRGRHRDGDQARLLPINIISEGVVTRSVRDTAAYLAALEEDWRNPALPPVGLVQGPARRRLRVGLLLDSPTATTLDDATREAATRTAALLEQQGHLVTPVAAPVTTQWADDFVLYWGLLATASIEIGKRDRHVPFDITRVDGFTSGLAKSYRRIVHKTPAALYRLRRSASAYATLFEQHELVVAPTLAHVAPPIGELSPTVPYAELIERLRHYAAFTPINNITGTPAISLPMGRTAEGLPVGVQLLGAHGDERTLIETAYALEEQQPWPTLAGG